MLWASIGSVVSTVGGLLVLAFASRMLGQEELGVYYVIVTITGLSAALGGLGDRSAIIKFLSSTYGQERENYLGVLLNYRLASMLFVAVVLVFGSPFLHKAWPDIPFQSVRWFMIVIPLLDMIYRTGSSFLAGFGLFKQFSLVNALNGLLRPSCSVAGLFLGYRVNGLLGGLVCSYVVSNTVLYIVSPFKLNLHCDWDKVKRVFRFSSFLYASYLCSLFTTKAAELLLAGLAGMASVAIYGNAMRFPNLLLMMFEAVRPVVLSYVSSLGQRTAEGSITAIRLLSGALCLASGFFIVFANLVIVLLFSEKYLDSISVSRVLAVWIVVSLVNYFCVVGLTGMGKTYLILVSNIVFLVCTVAGHLLLIPLWKEIGAAISLTVATTITTTLTMVLLVDKQRAILGRFFSAFNRSVVPLFCLFLLVTLTEPGILIGMLYYVIFVCTLYLLKAVTFKDIRILAFHIFYRPKSDRIAGPQANGLQ